MWFLMIQRDAKKLTIVNVCKCSKWSNVQNTSFIWYIKHRQHFGNLTLSHYWDTPKCKLKWWGIKTIIGTTHTYRGSATWAYKANWTCVVPRFFAEIQIHVSSNFSLIPFVGERQTPVANNPGSCKLTRLFSVRGLYRKFQPEENRTNGWRDTFIAASS